MAEKCLNCSHFHLLESKEKGIWHISACCTLRPDTEDGYEANVLVKREDDSCVDWEEGEDKWLTEI